MIDKAIDGSIKKYLFKKLMLPQGECKWDDTGGILRNDIPTMLQLLLKSSTQQQGLVFLT